MDVDGRRSRRDAGALTVSLVATWNSRELLWNLTLRELRTKYRRSFLGWTWSLLNPAATVIVYSYVFGVLFKSTPPEGDPSGIHSFAFYMLCALLPWNFFVQTTAAGMGAMAGNAALIRKVSFPRETLVFAQVLQCMVQFIIEMALLTAVMAVFGSPRLLLMLPFTILLMLLVALFATGVALILASVGVYFRDTPYLWMIVTQFWFFATPIVYPSALLEQLDPTVQSLLRLNPFAHVAEGFRRTMYDGRPIGLASAAVLAAIALVACLAGWRIFNRLSRRFAEEL